MPVLSVSAFRATVLPAFDVSEVFGKAVGFIGLWTGYDTDDKEQAFLVTAWESVESYNNFRSSKTFTHFNAKLNINDSAATTGIQINSNEYLTALNAPLTEIITLNAKEGKTRGELATVFASFAAYLHENAKGIHTPHAYGDGVASSGTSYALIGWDDVEAFKTAVTAQTFPPQVGKVAEVATAKVVKLVLAKQA
ncbi:hypothetical protein NMY22_g13971 [Coprinellus aureogranulatus]|nr:hypothetical protein NMY22_g13971 [Coprinellus aureogranulatus]